MKEELRLALIALAGSLIAVGLIVLAVFLIRRHMARTELMAMPDNTEGKIGRILRSYAAVNFCRTYTAYHFSYKGESYVIGHLMAGEFGILCIDALRYRGELYGALDDPTWTHYLGDEKETVPNASLELTKAASALQARLGEAGVFGTRMISFPVSLDKKLESYLPTPQAPVPVKELKKRLNTSEFTRRGNENTEKLAAVLDACMEDSHGRK